MDRIPENLNLDRLLKKTDCFITGFKGTGKTALLFFLDDKIREIDQSSCSAFIFFKDDFTEAKRREFEELSKRILSSISIKKDILLNGDEFESIWKWIIFKRIIDDNDLNNDGIFVKDVNWINFKKAIHCCPAKG